MEIIVIKCHGSNNDFLLIDEMTNGYTFTETERATMAQQLCNREGELGADGILYVLKSNHADARMRVFNTDGSEASMCGNGLRCVSRYVCELLKKDEAVIETMKADLRVSREEELYPNLPTYCVEISPVSFKLSDLPLNDDRETIMNETIESLSKELTFTAVAVPNPHLISIVSKEQVHSSIQEEISSYLNRENPITPDGVNVSFVIPMSDGNIYCRTFERGVGFTNACGTAMSSSSLVSCLLGLNKEEQKINVYNNGGRVQCVVHKDSDAYSIDLIGNATYVYETKVNWTMENYTVGEKKVYDQEAVTYRQFQEEAKRTLDQYL